MRFDGGPGGPAIAIAGEKLGLGADLTDRFGFDECMLDHRLLRVLTYLAMRRREGGEGWTDADELAFFADCGATGGSMAKLLERRLREVSGRASSEGGRLIEYWPRENVAGRRGGRFGGRSRGPYRMGIPASRIDLDPHVGWSILLGRPMAESSWCGDVEATLASARAHAVAGRFHEARQGAESALRAVHGGDVTRHLTGRDRAVMVGDTWALLSTLEMEMGLWQEGLLAARRARTLFTKARTPARVAHAWESEAHLLGQREDGDFRFDSVAAARNALLHLESSSRELRAGPRRAHHIGVLGQRLSEAGDLRGAAKKLVWALRTAHEAASLPWAAIWAARLAQNDIRAGAIASAEKNLTFATELTRRPDAAAEALLVRVTAEVMIASGRWSEAEPWVEKALLVGHQRGMQHQIRLARRLLKSLKERHRGPG
ncbi:Hypothetical protein CAP_1343 [Chondromyces apiculatus DSM 436]|uniref:MalT-like TPR region domain-containing protein n=1 Tax=Chondromyces apiculatus DSM 436 TaxID=1192034 RepID=A0A017SV12_9BACT|nr:Hypothetical protein CAP_1343 [Chondromyces apiculatus DSM 436]